MSGKGKTTYINTYSKPSLYLSLSQIAHGPNLALQKTSWCEERQVKSDMQTEAAAPWMEMKSDKRIR